MWVEELPVINLVYDFLFDEVPDYGQIKQTIEALALISALSLSVMFSFPTVVDYDEIKDFIARFDDGGVYDHCSADEVSNDGFGESGLTGTFGEAAYHIFIKDMTEGIVWNAVALLMVIIFYLCSANTQFYSERALKLWWRYVRWLLLGAVFALARGTLFSFLTIKDLYVIKLPDLYIEDREECPHWSDWPMDPASAWGYSVKLLTVATWPVIITSILLMSLATRANYRAEKGLDDWDPEWFRCLACLCRCCNKHKKKTTPVSS